MIRVASKGDNLEYTHNCFHHRAGGYAMRRHSKNSYIMWGLTAFTVIVLSICFFFSIFKMKGLFLAIRTFIGILKPFIYGATVAYLLLPVFNTLYKFMHPLFSNHMKKQKKAAKIAKLISSLFSVLLLLLIVSALLSMVLPQLASSVLGLADSMPAYLKEISTWLEDLLHNSPVVRENLMQVYEKFANWVTNWIRDDMLPQIIELMGGGLLGTVTMLKNVVVGIIIAIYVLNSKDLFSAQAKKFTYSLFDTTRANLFIKNVRFMHRVFGGFITGKLIDSMIIGIICFVVMSLLNMQYTVLISVIIGITNIIPFFGPFIGAVPSALLLLMVSPIKCIYFIIFILILQQFDGNILGPKILGDSTGLSSFWVMFAILIAGGLFGFVGMILGVPLFAVIYSLISSLVNRSLGEKSLPVDTIAYFDLDHIDPETHKPVPMSENTAEETSVSLHDKPKKTSDNQD